MFTRETVEQALDANQIYVKMNSGNWWRARRNGMTKTWKTRPNEFKIPIKMGLRDHAYITDENMNNGDFIQRGPVL